MRVETEADALARDGVQVASGVADQGARPETTDFTPLERASPADILPGGTQPRGGGRGRPRAIAPWRSFRRIGVLVVQERHADFAGSHRRHIGLGVLRPVDFDELGPGATAKWRRSTVRGIGGCIELERPPNGEFSPSAAMR